MNSRSARVLFLLVVPGHLVFLYTISCMQGGHTTLTLIFIIFYMTAALLQVRTGRGVGGPGLPPGVGGEGQGRPQGWEGRARDRVASERWTGAQESRPQFQPSP